MKWVKDFKVLKEFGYQPRLWLENCFEDRWYYTDGYEGAVEPSTVEGNPMFISLPSWEEGEPIGQFKEEYFDVMRELNADWYPEEKPNYPLRTRRRTTNEYLLELKDCTVSSKGLLYTRYILDNYEKKDFLAIFEPNRCSVQHPKENTTQITLIDDTHKREVTLDSAANYVTLLLYNYIPDVAAELINAKLRDTALQLAGDLPDKYFFSDSLLIENGIFDYTQLNQMLYALVKTPEGFVQLSARNHNKMEYPNTTKYLDLKLQSVVRNDLRYKKNYVGYATKGLFCSHLEFKDNVLDIRIRSIVGTPEGYNEVLDLPLHLVEPDHDYVDPDFPQKLVLCFAYMYVQLTPSLVTKLDTSKTIEDVFSKELLDSLYSHNSYARKGPIPNN